MKILSQQQIRAVDAYTIEHEPISSIDLMERAAIECADWISNYLYKYKGFMKVAVFAGPGNNGGDGLAIARFLHKIGYRVSVFMLTESSKLSPDALVNYQRLKDRIKPVLLTPKNLPELSSFTLVIDALFGVGLTRPLDGLAAKTVKHINKSRCQIVSIDMPSGLFCEDNTGNNPENIINAWHTLTFQQPKLSFFFEENDEYIGKWTILDIGLSKEAIKNRDSKYYMLEHDDIEANFCERSKFVHKSNFGRVLIIAGSRGMMGAATLATKACLRAGAGIVTAHVPKKERQIMQIAVPEAIVSLDENSEVFSKIPDMINYDVIAVGPGIRKKLETQNALLALINNIKARNNKFEDLILDADALNIIAENRDWLSLLPPKTIITPHPGEFDRLFGKFETGYERHLKQIEMAQKYSIFIVLKGAHTSIATPEGTCYFNKTGNPGMATAGSGDVLTGIIAGLLPQLFSPFDAACAGVWLHGAAGDIAVKKTGEQALIASDIIENLGKAFIELRIENEE